MLVSVVVQLQSSPAINKLSSMRTFIVDPFNGDILAFLRCPTRSRRSLVRHRGVNKFQDLCRETHAPRAMASGGARVLRA
jgi:hypothetical protein